jgi:hypothetical protein
MFVTIFVPPRCTISSVRLDVLRAGTPGCGIRLRSVSGRDQPLVTRYSDLIGKGSQQPSVTISRTTGRSFLLRYFTGRASCSTPS